MILKVIAILVFAILVHRLVAYLDSRPKKTFAAGDKKTNILITGSAQGLGKLLAEKFAHLHSHGEVNLILLDIAEHLAPQLLKDVKAASNKVDFSFVHFYKINLASQAEIDSIWEQVTQKHGPIHILINNAAICLGRKVEELSVSQVKLTMDINFMSYVSLMMLFMRQPEVKGASKHRF